MNQEDSSTTKSSITLSEVDIETIMATTNFSRDKIISWHEAFLKDCPDGKLTREKLDEVSATFYPNRRTKKFSGRMFNVFDKDKNGFIDFHEFMIGLALSGHQDAIGKLKLSFRLYDINNNGRIERKEMRKIMRAIYDLIDEKDDDYDDAKEATKSQRIKEHADQIFEFLDADHNGSIDLDEFIQGCSSDPQLMQMLAPINFE